MSAMCQVMLKKETPCLAPCWISGNGGELPLYLLFLQFTQQNPYSLFTVAHSVSENQDAISQEGRHNHKTRVSRNQKQQVSYSNIICGETILHVRNCNAGAQVMCYLFSFSILNGEEGSCDMNTGNVRKSKSKTNFIFDCFLYAETFLKLHDQKIMRYMLCPQKTLSLVEKVNV